MPDWLLFAVFASHLPFFAWRWRRTGERRFAATTLTFSLLACVYGLKVLAPEWRVGGTPLHAALRVPALAAAALSIGLLLRHWLRRS